MPRKSRTIYAADFEATTDPNDCRVWSWGYANINTPHDVEMGIDLGDFLSLMTNEDSICYFHNLKYDGPFIIDYLFNHGFKWVDKMARHESMTFKTLISDMGKYFSITVKWANGKTTEFRDSLKKLPFSISRIAKSFKLDESKGEIDYHVYRPVGHELTPQEADYLRRDVSILAEAMRQVIESGMTKLTVASDALNEYKELNGSKFDRLFPVLTDWMDSEIRRALRGGWTYADERFKGRQVGGGLVLDVNSLYPYIMMERMLPYGEPEYVEGQVLPTERRPLTIFSVTFTARLKKGHVPCIQIKNNMNFTATEYLKNITEPTTLMVTNVDWALYNDHYDIDVLSYEGGWRFGAAIGMFDNYINKWSAIKAAETGGKREIAKLQLNSLFGKFGTNPNVASKHPIMKDGVVKLVRDADERRAPIYTAVAVFITSFARDLTIRAAQANYDTFAYADTDSLHLLRDTIPKEIEVHKTKLGAWKHEYDFDAAFYMRAKGYIERHPECICDDDPHHKPDERCYTTHIAGLPERIANTLTFADIVNGNEVHGKLKPVSVSGGIVLMPTPYKIKF